MTDKATAHEATAPQREFLSESDRNLFQKARQASREAVMQEQFILTHLGETYKLTQQDTFDIQTGLITRFEPPPPEAAPKTARRFTEKKV
jgi:hypothetical protein